MKKFGLIAIIIACVMTGCSGEKKQTTEAGSVTATVSDGVESTEEVTTEVAEEEATTEEVAVAEEEEQGESIKEEQEETAKPQTTTTVSQNDKTQVTTTAQQTKPQSEKPASTTTTQQAKPQATAPQSEKPQATTPAPQAKPAAPATTQQTKPQAPATTEAPQHEHNYNVWIVDKAAWTETIEHPEEGHDVIGAECNYCGQFFNTGGEANAHGEAQADDAHFCAGWGTASRYVVDKAAWTETVQHPEEGHWECSCGAKK